MLRWNVAHKNGTKILKHASFCCDNKENWWIVTGFYSWGDWGVSHQAAKILPVPPTDYRPHFLTRASAVPPTVYCPQKFQKFYLIFLLLLSSKLHQKALMCSNFAVGGHFWLQRTIFLSPSSSDSVPDAGSPHLTPSPRGTENHPQKQVSPSKILCKNQCCGRHNVCRHLCRHKEYPNMSI